MSPRIGRPVVGEPKTNDVITLEMQIKKISIKINE